MKKAFTLIELIVVIAIIAIVAAILLPVFTQAKVSAKQTTSLSNIKQLGSAYILYVNEYDDYTPYIAETSIMIRLRLGLSSYSDWPGYFGQLTIKDQLSPYTQSEGVWQSPLDPGDLTEFGVSVSNYTSLGTSYDSLPTSFCFGSLSALKNTSESAILREGFFLNNRAFTYRADSSVKHLPWSNASDQIGNTQTDFGCDD